MGYRCAAEIAKTSQCIYCYQMKPEFTCYNLFDNLDAIQWWNMITPIMPLLTVVEHDYTNHASLNSGGT